MTYLAVYAPVGAKDKEHCYRVDQIDDQTGNYVTVGRHLTRQQAEAIAKRLDEEERAIWL